MKKYILGLLLLGFSSHAIPSEGVTAYHKLKENETLWFVAQIYYGDGSEYTKLLLANHLDLVADVPTGTEIAIPNPKWVETMPGFQARFKRIFHKREVALLQKREGKALRVVASVETENKIESKTPVSAPKRQTASEPVQNKMQTRPLIFLQKTHE